MEDRSTQVCYIYALNESLTWHDGHSLQSPENPECSEACEVAQFDEGGEVAWKMASKDDTT